ncbi:MAG TPA: hypothetical protein VHP37_18570 [Burkholderiales bacterium]|nr:hypothetical protein [Burkholderiales bacterium]
MKASNIALAVAAAAAPAAFAQNQPVKPPIAVYWMSVETAGGMGFAMPAGMGGMLPANMQGGKRMHLDLGSTQSSGGTPRADHAIPAGVNMGASLPLLTPQTERAQAPRPERDTPQTFEQPKGRMLIYWGCGETVRAGQPVVIDFAKLGSAEGAKAFRARNVNRPQGPGPGRSRTYGEWPNRENSTAVPQQASLVGDHVVAGSYTPEIKFAIDNGHDFMAPVAFDPIRKTGAGAFQVKWQSIPTAIGYFATAVGQGEQQNDMVMWSSSEVQEMGQVLMDYLPPAEVQRLIREKVVMTPQTTECAVPGGIFKSEGAMLNFIAYGDELNVVHPPRPKDPKQTWVQEYAVKVRLKSTGMTMLAEGDASGGSRRAGGRGAPAAAPEQQAQQPAAPASPIPGGTPVEQGINILRGIFGR